MTDRRILAVALACLLAACQPTATRPVVVAPPPPAAAEPQAGPNDLLDAVAWMQTSVEARLIAGQTWRSALMQLDKAIKTPGWDALTAEDRDAPFAELPPAVIVDVDETVLDNMAYEARLVKTGQDYNDFSWSQWVQEAAAPPVPGSLEFARAASARGVTVFYLSNRAADLGPATLANLRKDGFPIKDDSQFLGLGTFVKDCEDVGTEKTCRRRLVGRSHRVLLQVGDQVGDFATVLANTPEGREQAMRPYLAWVGERWFVLPNPAYGSWEPALFNNDWSRPAAERRKAKIDALRD